MLVGEFAAAGAVLLLCAGLLLAGVVIGSAWLDARERRHILALYSAGWAAIDWRDGSAALAMASRLRARPAPAAKFLADMLEIRQRTNAGESDVAIELARALMARFAAGACPWFVLNDCVDVMVSAGRYRDALAMTGRNPADPQAGRAELDAPGMWDITQINQAEALHCLGRDDDALERLEIVRAGDLKPLAAAGLHCLEAWIRVHRGELGAARAALDAVDASALAPYYLSEVHYTHAALAREERRLDVALDEARKGMACLQRASSERNGRLLLAGIHELRGERDEATSCFERAITHPYRGQGGDGLLRFAELRSQHGDDELVMRALRLVVERDPESVFANRARERLAGMGEAPQQPT